VLGAAVLVTAALAGLTTGADPYGADIGTGLRVAAILLAVLTNVGHFILAFRALTGARARPAHRCRRGRRQLASRADPRHISVTHALRDTQEA
jgi:hypothetical protein